MTPPESSDRAYWLQSTKGLTEDEQAIVDRINWHTLSCRLCRVEGHPQRDGSIAYGFSHCKYSSALITSLDVYRACLTMGGLNEYVVTRCCGPDKAKAMKERAENAARSFEEFAGLPEGSVTAISADELEKEEP